MNRLYIRSLSTLGAGTALKTLRQVIADLTGSDATAEDALGILRGKFPILVAESDDRSAIEAASEALEAAGYGTLVLTSENDSEALESTRDDFDAGTIAGAEFPLDDALYPVSASEDAARAALVLMNATDGRATTAIALASNLSRALGEDPDAEDAVMFDAAVLLATTFSGPDHDDLMERIALAAGIHPATREAP